MKYLILILLFVSCASSSSQEWGPWVDKDVDIIEREWAICHEEKDGPKLHMAGFCWSLDECRTRKTILNNTREECRVKIVHCPWGDKECMIKYHLNGAKLILNPRS